MNGYGYVTVSCLHCGESFTQVSGAVGRPAVYCSGRCRVAAHRKREAQRLEQFRIAAANTARTMK